MIDIECGPTNDIRRFRFNLPETPKHLGVMVSGGIDSALLYYMMLKLNNENGNIHKITPYSIMRKEGSHLYAAPVIEYVSGLFGIKETLNVVGNNKMPEEVQVKSGIYEILFRKNVDIAYVGVIEQLDIHMVNWKPIPTVESDRFKTPLKILNKSHVIDLIYKLNQENILKISHSCVSVERCNSCNGCNERAWAFAQLGKEDIGIL